MIEIIELFLMVGGWMVLLTIIGAVYEIFLD